MRFTILKEVDRLTGSDVIDKDATAGGGGDDDDDDVDDDDDDDVDDDDVPYLNNCLQYMYTSFILPAPLVEFIHYPT